MSDTFKFLGDQAGSTATRGGGNAAQDFLAKQMAKNKFLDTAQPIENVGKQTTTDPYAFGEGSLPGGEGYKDQQIVLNQKEIDAWHKANPNDKEGGSGGSWENIPIQGYGATRYKNGQWGAGNMSIEDLRKKFNLSDDESAASGERAIYGYNKDGSKVFIGAVTGDLKDNSELVSAHSRQRHPDEVDHTGDALSSDGDVKGAILNLWKAGDGEGGGEVEGPPKPEMGIKPIEHSQEIKQAKERVKTYEQNIESGQTSQEIFGNSSFMDKYQQDFSKGAQGIGTNATSSSQESANSATQSFLDNKVSQVKKTLSPIN